MYIVVTSLPVGAEGIEFTVIVPFSVASEQPCAAVPVVVTIKLKVPVSVDVPLMVTVPPA